MGFINERISKEDRIEYGLDELENSVPKGVWFPDRDWTIDKERKIYLRQMWQSNSGPEPELSPKFIYRTYYFFIDNKIYQVEIKDDIENKVQKSDGYFKLISTVISIEPLPNNDDLMCFIRILNKAFLARKGTGIYSNWIKKFDLTLIYKNFEIKNV